MRHLSAITEVCIHAASRRIAHEIVHLDALAFAVEATRLHHGIEADLIAKLEAVSERLLRAVDAHDYAIEMMGLHALGICLAGEPVGLDRWVVQTGFLSTARQRYVYFVGYLGGELLARRYTPWLTASSAPESRMA